MKELGILFIHHATGPTTRNNLDLLREFNPDAEIVTISQGGETFPGGYNTNRLWGGGWRPFKRKINEYGWRALVRKDYPQLKRAFTWWTAELCVYQWYTQKRENARRWIVAEWDTLCLEPARSFFEPVWDLDVAGANLKDPKTQPEWCHFTEEELGKLPAAYRPFALGLTPLPGLFFSDRALREISFSIRSEPGLRRTFCELRVGTVANYLGFKPVEISPRAKATLQDVHEFKANEVREPGYWHKVKDHDPPVDATAVLGAGAARAGAVK